VGFVGYKIALGQVFLRILRFSPVVMIHLFTTDAAKGVVITHFIDTFLHVWNE
jgi:hypothetical protein